MALTRNCYPDFTTPEARCEDDLQQLSYDRQMLAASLEPNVITIPYLARPHFRPFHASTKRFRYIVSHRRAGKSVALIVHMIIQCINNKRQQPPPKYAYVAPSFAAAKDLVWQYLKYYTANIPGMRYVEGELSAIFPTRDRYTGPLVPHEGFTRTAE